VDGNDAYAGLSLGNLAIPKFDILEVRGEAGPRWYELSGDTASFPGTEPVRIAEAAR
jgi:hypothetical protein